ncbi:MAG: hypothetical protein ABI469_02875 [Gemmatimonadales bacterium]
MTEDKFEDFLKKASQSYNAPPARAPREEMWSAIQAKRAAGPRVVYGGGSPAGVNEKRFGTRLWLGAAAAAMLLVATGVGIGRLTAPATQTNVASVPSPQRAMAAEPDEPDPSATPDRPGNGTTNNPTATPGSPNSRAPSAVATNRSGLTQTGTGSVSQVATNLSPSAGTPSAAYQLTAVRHLSEAEALLTSFRARSTADQQMDAQLGAWARQLLSNTRLLLDSPVANDPRRRPLLEDLELVLVQIVQLSPGSTPQDRDLIEKSLQHDHVMTRLRTAIPAGSQRGG